MWANIAPLGSIDNELFIYKIGNSGPNMVPCGIPGSNFLLCFLWDILQEGLNATKEIPKNITFFKLSFLEGILADGVNAKMRKY